MVGVVALVAATLKRPEVEVVASLALEVTAAEERHLPVAQGEGHKRP